MINSRRCRVALAFAASAGVCGLSASVRAGATNLPIGLTAGSFNYDQVVTGGTSSAPTFAGAAGYTTPVAGGVHAVAVDDENPIDFYSTGFSATGGLPTSGLFTSSYNGGASQFQMQVSGGDYNVNNAMVLNTDTEAHAASPSFWATVSNPSTGSVSLSTPSAYSSLALLYAATVQGSPVITYTLNFSGGTTYTSSFTPPNWGSTTNRAISLSRQWVDGSGKNNTGYGMTEYDIAVPAADYGLKLASIGFSTTGSGYYGHNPVNPVGFSLYAVSGSALTGLTYTGTDPTTPASWDTTSLNFNNSGTASAFTATGGIATFDDSAAGSTSVNIPSAVTPFATIFNNNFLNYNFSGQAIAGTGSVTLNGTAAVTFANTNTYTGATLVNAGSLILAPGVALASGTVNISTGALVALKGSNQLASTTVLTDNGSFNLSGASAAITTLNGTSGAAYIDSVSVLNVSNGTFAGSLNLAGGGLNKVTSGTLVLSGVNNFAGPTTISAGTLQLVKTGSTYTGGTFNVASGATLNLAVGGATNLTTAEVGTVLGISTLNYGSVLTLDTTGGNFSLSSNLPTGGYGLTKNGINSLTVSGSNSYSGATLVSNGTLVVGSGSAIPLASTLTLGNGTVLDLAPAAGTGTLNAFPIAFTTASAIVQVQSDNAVAGPGVTYNLGNASMVAGSFNVGAGSNVTSGLGGITLGTLSLASATAGAATQLNANGASLTVGTITPSAGTTHTITLSGSLTGVGTVTGAIGDMSPSGATTLIKNGSSIWTLSGNSTYSGSTTVTNGVLNLTGQINNTSTLTVGSLSGGAACLYQSGSTSNLSLLSTSASIIGNVAGASAYYGISGGTVNLESELDIGGSSGTSTTFSRFDMAGGTFNITATTSPVNSFPSFIVNRGPTGESSVVNITGGTVQLTALYPDAGNQGLTADWNTNQTSVITVGGIGSLTPAQFLTPSLSVKLNHGAATNGTTPGSTGVSSTLNLDGGGTLQTLGVGGGTTSGTNSSVFVNFNGGTLKAGNTSNSSFIQNVGGVYIYGGGAKIDDNGQSITITQPLLAPTGSGVSSVAITTAGSGYVAPPRVTFTSSDGNGVDATGYATISPTTGGLTGIVITNPGTGYDAAPTVTLTANTGFAGTAASGFTASTATNAAGGLTKLGVGTLTLSNSSTYTGTTNISAGTLVLDHSGTNLGGLASPVSIGSSATFQIKGNTSIGALTTASGSTFSMIDPTTGTVDYLNVGGNFNVANGSVFNLNINTASTGLDTINVSGTALVSGTSTINLLGGSITAGNYVLFNASGGGFNPNGAGFSILAHPAGRYNGFSFNASTGTQEILTVSSTPASPVEYWTGAASYAFGDSAHNWSTGTTTTNFSNNSAGTVDASQIPGPISDVVFTAARVNSSSSTLTTQLDANFSVKGLYFVVPALNAPATQITSTVVNLGSNALTLGIDGMGLSTNSLSGGTVGTGSVVLGSSQSWANNNSTMALTVNANISSGTSGTTLTLNGTGSGGVTLGGAISDGAGPLALVFGQTGVIQLGGSNTYTGGTTINAGTILLNNAAGLSTGAITMTGGQIDLGGTSPTFTTLNGSGGGITNSGATATVTVNTGTYAGNIVDGTGTVGLVKATAANLNLTGVNTYSGLTNVSAGTLQLGGPSAASYKSPLTITAGATLDLNGNPATYASLSGAGLVTNSNSTPAVLTLKTAGSSSFSGTLSDGASQSSLVFSGVGNQFLTAPSTFSGGSTISSGTVTISSTTALGTGPVTLSGGKLSVSLPTSIQSISGFSTGSGPSQFQLNRRSDVASQIAPTITGNVLTITDTSTGTTDGESASAFTNNAIDVGANIGFTANFVYQAVPGSGEADGATFTIQNDPRGSTAIGSVANNLGFSSGSTSGQLLPIANAIAIEFNVYAGYTIGTTLVTAGPTGTTATSSYNDVTASNVNLQTDPISVTVTYNASAGTVTENLTDQTTLGTYSNVYSGINLSSILGGTTGYVGFTGGTGGSNSTQTISNFSFTSAAGANSGIANNVVGAAGTSSTIQLQVSSGSTAVAIGSLTVGAYGSVSVTSLSNDLIATHGTLITSALSLAGATDSWTGKLDLNNNALDVSASSASISTITNQVKQGYAGGTWQGSGGITSSAAAADSTHLTALGVLYNDNGSGTPFYGVNGTIATTFDGAIPFDGDVLVKYTYYGDANLDGKVDGSDYSVIDNSFLMEQNGSGPITGWQNGDFNYDGVVDGSDYTLIDNAFNMQGAAFTGLISASPTAQIDGSSAVPEPASLGLIGLMACGMLGRRRAKNRSRN
jgi:autotransporter-associated beta strand protein